MYDIAVIGDGPAGLSAGINALARNKKVVIIGKGIEYSALYKAKRVDNYLGMYGESGKKLLGDFNKHALEMGAELKKGRVVQIYDVGDYFGVNIENEIIEASTVILASGISKGKSILGEDKYLGKGVSYCATCDGMLYKGKNVVIIGEVDDAENDAIFLKEICENVVYIPTYGQPKKDIKGVVIKRGRVKEIVGNESVKGVIVDDENIDCDGVFIIKKNMPLNSLLSGLEIKDGLLVVDREGKTNVNGVFACGDVTGEYYQVAKAVGEGLVAGLSAAKFLDDKK